MALSCTHSHYLHYLVVSSVQNEQQEAYSSLFISLLVPMLSFRESRLLHCLLASCCTRHMPPIWGNTKQVAEREELGTGFNIRKTCKRWENKDHCTVSICSVKGLGRTSRTGFNNIMVVNSQGWQTPFHFGTVMRYRLVRTRTLRWKAILQRNKFGM